MKKYSIFHLPILSFFSGELYRDVALNWRGVCFGYLFLLILICTIPRMFHIKNRISLFIDEEAPSLLENVPKISITDGQVQIDEPQPYYIMAPDSNEVIAIIDTTGEIQSLDDTDAFILLTKTKLIHRQSDVEYRTYDLSDVKEFELDENRIMGWLNTFKKLVLPLFFPFILLGSFVFRIIQALIYAAIGLVFASIYNLKLSYNSLLRMAVVAITPCIIVRTVFKIASVQIPMSGLWFFLLAMGYLFFGVWSISQAGKIPTDENPIILSVKPSSNLVNYLNV